MMGPKNVARAFDKIYDEVDDLLTHGQFEKVNNILDSLDLLKVHEILLCGYLTITACWRKELNSRAPFYEKVEKVFIEKHGKEEALEILKGLK
jgi:hypothetical protein